MSVEAEVLVRVAQGEVRGRVLRSVQDVQYYEFKGIPYAKPPVGELRFRAPQPPEPWEGVRDATKDCNVCPQLDRQTSSVVGDEDCLFLNVFTSKLPKDGSKPLPVMFFLHGGGFLFGTGTDVKKHGPDYFISADVVLVSINYRLGVLGFLCLDLPEAQGNMGLKDQIQALKWVKENIAEFGGDPSNVTIFGVSAGGASVEYLQLSPIANGLFHKAIIQSGSALNAWARNPSATIKNIAFRMAKNQGKLISDEKELLKYLKGLQTESLVQAAAAAIASSEFKGGINFGFVPTVEKSFENSEAFLTEEPYNLLKRGAFTKVPMISGFCRRERLLLCSHAPEIIDGILNDKQLAGYLPFRFDEEQRSDLERKLKTNYLDSIKSGDESDDFIIKFFTDVDFLGGLWVATKLKAEKSSPVYLYEFAYDGSLNYLKKKNGIDRVGACHGDEGGYLMRSDILPDDVSDTDKNVRNRMIRMWTSFARTGDPTETIDDVIPTSWRPISDQQCEYLVIDNQLTMADNLYPQRMKLFEHLYDKHWV